MALQAKNKSVFAGLAVAAWSLPTCAHALTLGAMTIDDRPVYAGIGVLAGAAVMGLIYDHKNRKLAERVVALESVIAELEREDKRVVGRHAAQAGQANFRLRNPENAAAVKAGAASHIAEPAEPADPEPSAQLAKPETEPAAEKPAVKAAAKPAPVYDTPADAVAAMLDDETRAAEAAAAKAAAAQAACQKAVEAAKPAAAATEPAAKPKPAAHRRAIEVPGDDLVLPERAPHRHVEEEDEYERVATEYVAKKNFASKMASRAKGVARLLSERIGGDAMEGLPVIERADGTVGDVGTSWWETAQSEAHREIASDFDHTFAGVTPAGEDFTVNAVMMGEPAAVAVAMTTGKWDIVGMNMKTPETGQFPVQNGKSWRVHTDEFDIVGRGEKIAHAVPFVDNGAYPEHKDAPAKTDAWEASLAAMDRRVDDNLMSKGEFSDFVGGISTIDEPDGLEDNTRHLSFRTPAGHPEVQDTASYINFLVNSELGGSVKPKRKARGTTGPLEVAH